MIQVKGNSAVVFALERKLARVVVPSSVREALIYLVPSVMRDELKAGMRVLVPLGKRRVTGVVIDFPTQTSVKNLKEISAVLDERPVLDSALLKLCRWISSYYLSSLGEAVTTAFPSILRQESVRSVVCRQGSYQPVGKLEKEVFAEVEKRGRVPVKTLARRFAGRGLYRVLDHLASTGAVEIEERLKVGPTRKSARGLGILTGDRSNPPPGLALSHAQGAALQPLAERLDRGGFETFLLHGVTGSGKTEVYIQAMERAWRHRRRSLILVPEISLTPQLLDRLCERFPDQVGLFHSGLSPGERWSQWRRIVRGEVTVVVGARSAIFAPVPDLGLIVVDEEHDSSYKQEEGLRYHARDLAVVRGRLMGCPVLLGSATPSVESFYNCTQGRYRLLEMAERVARRPLPEVETVDLRPESREQHRGDPHQSPDPSLFSPRLGEALRENHARGQQSLIFLNRRGFASFLQCGLCGFVLRCPHCSISLTYHLKQTGLFCHHCGFCKAASDLCPQCGNPTLSGIGSGTEKIEQELVRLIPGARIGRMDRDTTRRRGSQERLIRQWERGEIEILVGTQMVTKGHDVGGVTLVGVILADLSLNLPDFRAAERSFQLLSQVAGRAGRGEEPGRVIIQTFVPDHYSFEFTRTHDYGGFFACEIEFRRALNYPPFSRLVQLRLEGSALHEVEHGAKLLGQALRKLQTTSDMAGKIEILGPAPAPISRLRNRYRWHILLKGPKGPAVLGLAQEARASLPRSGKARLHIDVDPYNML